MNQGRRPAGTRTSLDFLVCPPEDTLDGFVRAPEELGPDLVRAVSRHLNRCATCREEVDRRRRGQEAAGTRRPWIWAVLALAGLACSSLLLMRREIAGVLPAGGVGTGARPDPRLAALARFEPPSEAALAAAGGLPSGRGGPAPWLSVEDDRQLSAARDMIDATRFSEAAGLLEDLASRHPERGALRLLLAYASVAAGDLERGGRHYTLADEMGAGPGACLGRANVCLRLGDVACAQRELADHLLAARPDDGDARDLLARITAFNARSGPSAR
ncbi:MAG TPA: hypothetical protein VFP98_08215 [Candidatus Polarisedimenticolia bacterium]|nr:hypothetical protein [Candidatus Polarisedimenticolia bacterium]